MSQRFFLGILYIKDGIIRDFGVNLDYNCTEIDGEGLVLMPSLDRSTCSF